MNRPTKRIPNRMAPQHLVTFQITAPKSTHTRKASCEEVRCLMYANGWRMKIDLGTDLGQKQAYYIKYQSGRSFKKVAVDGTMVTLEFAASQPCFKEHRVRTDLPEIYRVKGGDNRGNPLKTPTRVHKKPEFWVEEFAENQDRIARIQKKG
jgi:hypothetical protein